MSCSLFLIPSLEFLQLGCCTALASEIEQVQITVKISAVPCENFQAAASTPIMIFPMDALAFLVVSIVIVFANIVSAAHLCESPCSLMAHMRRFASNSCCLWCCLFVVVLAAFVVTHHILAVVVLKAGALAANQAWSVIGIQSSR